MDRFIENMNETIKKMDNLGVISQKTKRDMEEVDYPNIKDLTATEIASIRRKSKLSQPVFAQYLNMNVSTIRQWEQGKKHPSGASLKLLNIIMNKGIEVLI